MDYNADVTVDAKGQKCPMPVLLTSRAAKGLDSGQIMVVEATDAGSRSDIPSWAKDSGNELLDTLDEAGVYRYVIKKA
jgi:tRNA 2-thiouridine synthesizing protein A